MMDLKKSWDDCIEMWEWIIDHLDEGSICDLKGRYCHENNISIAITNCNFCEYAFSVGTCREDCPGKLIDKQFSCCHPDYHYVRKPVKFLAKLKELYPY